MIQKLLLNAQIVWMIFIKILTNALQIRNKKNWSYLMIWLLIYLAIKKLNPVVSELFIRERKLMISPVIITQFYIAVTKYTRLNLTHYFVIKIPKKYLMCGSL